MRSFATTLKASLVLTIFMLQGLDCFPTGGVLATCLTLLPRHGYDLTWNTSGVCPFTMKLSSNTYNPGDTITIAIEADDNVTKLMGIQIGAHRKSVNIEEPVGTFLSFTPDDKLQGLACFGLNNSQVTHRKPDPVSRVELVWQAPEVNVGDITFKATFVKNHETFWVWETKELKGGSTNIVQPEQVVETPSEGTEDVDFSGCGETKGCFLYPRYCQGSDCYVALTYKKTGQEYEFELRARAPGYVAVGLSNDREMGGDQTVVCTAEGDLLTVQLGYNPRYFNFRTLMRNLTQLSVRKTSDHMMCKFRRPRVLFTPTPGQVDLNDNWYILLAWGYVAVKTDVVSQHAEAPVITDSMVNFQSYSTYRGSALDRGVQAHGCLMVVAWVLFSGVSAVLARHYKTIFNRKMVCGAQIWFQLHRGAAVSAFLFTMTSFILIFVWLKELADGEGRTHAIFGIVLFVTVCLQIVGGVLRPSPDAKHRPIFRWAHRIIGNAARIIAAATIYLAFSMGDMPRQMQEYGAVAVPVWIAAQVVWELILEAWSWRKQASQGSTDFTSSSGMTVQQGEKSSPVASRGDYILLSLYLITLIAFSVLLLCGINLF